ncbi:putative thiamine transport system permease protein [Chromohalobacter canadensis]|uniref:Putative thiamine transport system permease protein n=1 Tax=Chromohalobacter canadensis TaxID=141389 RepID=A0A285VHP2_9GAMM|nr:MULTISPECIES: ABC transporter permease subunit [Chromohalobacter]SOC53088.1 putative thiamine transport system permease protein [Chromohalobacter canadensis]
MRTDRRLGAFALTVITVRRLTLTLIGLSVGVGLLGVLAPAFGWLPALGGEQVTLAHWRALFAKPGLVTMITLSLVPGIVSALVAFIAVVTLCGTCLHMRLFSLLRRLLSPLLAVPHAAAAIGLAFLIAPSGLASRAISPWATGWQAPPDYLLPGDPWGLALTLGLVTKEMPFLLLMTLAALPQCQAAQRLQVARALGYAPLTAFLKGVLPSLYPLIRLPLFAVIAYATASVDMALILGPSTPPPLAVAVIRWMQDPQLSMRFVASSAAVLQLIVTLGALALWWLGERVVIWVARARIHDGRRHTLARSGPLMGLGLAGLPILLMLAGLLGLVLWSLATYWPFPELFPSPLTARNWIRALPSLYEPLLTTSALALLSTFIALVLVTLLLEAEHITAKRRDSAASFAATTLLYLPLLVPPVAFLFGLVQWQTQLGMQPGHLAVLGGHLLFVLPYVYLSLAESQRRLDPRWTQMAATLGAGPARRFWRVRLPLLTVPLLTASAVGMAVSVAQYLPTVLLGAGRVTTLTSEAVSLASGGDRRLTAVLALLQLALPALGFLLALGLPRWCLRNRSGLWRTT